MSRRSARSVDKLGRNDPCWCRASKKFKNCHLDRDKQPPLTLQDRIDAWRLAYGVESCMHPDAGPSCSGKIVRAHTLRRSADLKRIARDGRVYGFKGDLTKPPERVVEPKLMGIGQASTFTGFCSTHDASLFGPIEQQPLAVSPEHAALLSYRGICRELYLKSAAITYVNTMRQGDRGWPLDEQIAHQVLMDGIERSYRLAARDLEEQQAAVGQILRSRDFGPVRFLAVEFAETPDVLLAAGIFPDETFQGDRLQRLDDMHARMDGLWVSIVTKDAGGVAILSWLAPSVPCERFARSLDHHSDDELPHALTRLAFMCENTFLSPNWWEAVPPAHQDRVKRRILETVHPETPAPSLKDDGLRVVSWTTGQRTRHF
jgi:hypothetical protein